MKIALNGKFMTSPPTAVHRVGYELGCAFCRARPRDTVGFLVRATDDGPGLPRDVPHEALRNLRPLVWEQIILPRALKGRILLNLCNTTPLLARNAFTMVHDAQVFTAPISYTFLRRQWLRLHTRLAGRLQRGLLTVSDFAKGELVDLGIAPASRIHVIHNGVDHILRVDPDDTVLDRLALAPRGYALALANTQPHKNIGVLLRAFA
ncbi:hypothetical protein SAMN04488003_11857, partial [Loktanella fryxellensis]